MGIYLGLASQLFSWQIPIKLNKNLKNVARLCVDYFN
jgi:hypothetical protein